MRKTIQVLLLMAMGWLALPAPAWAFYNPSTGRWLNRDPIGEKAGDNLYGLVEENPISNVDTDGRSILGRQPIEIPWPAPWPIEIPWPNPWPFPSPSPSKPRKTWPTLFELVCPFKCNGQVYNPITHCCCGDSVVSRDAVDTGIATHRWEGVPGPNGTPYHVWLAWPGGSLDINAIIGMYIVSSPAAGPILYTPASYTPLKLSPCKYDFEKLINCLNTKAAALKGQQRIGTLCDSFAKNILWGCIDQSEGCTAR
jgi:hypothetical protein